MPKIPGLSVASLKKHVELIPLFGAVAFGCMLAGGYLTRLATNNPDVTWNKRRNPEPWNKWKQTDRYKFYAKSMDYNTHVFPKERPDMSNATYSGI